VRPLPHLLHSPPPWDLPIPPQRSSEDEADAYQLECDPMEFYSRTQTRRRGALIFIGFLLVELAFVIWVIGHISPSS
jgi:hypothetical protein